ncbi:MAG: PqqD family protein [Enhydrobacter sp.]|nr:MAG: PqqD family protein [Enhydrobacter sp.]
MLDATTVLRKSEHQVSCNLDEEVAILETNSARYFGLNEVGAHIWRLLDQPSSVDHICKSVADHFDVERAACSDDVLRFLRRMHEAGLIEPVAESRRLGTANS